MGFDLFKKEEDVIAKARAFLEGGGVKDGEASTQFETLLKSYEKLHKSSKKLVRLSDRS